MSSSPSTQLSAQGISQFYGNFTALDGIDLDVRQGEFLTLLGPSGSGKTTLLMILAGFLTPSAGKLLERGVDISRRPAEKRNYGMVFQGYALFPHMSVADNVAYPLRIRGVKAEERQRRVKHILEVVGLGAHLNKKPSELSGGQQQRVAIARALVFEPDMLLLDEPLSALDKNLREQLQTELQRIHRQVGTSFVFVTHDQGEALALSTRIAIFNQGRLAQIDTPETIYDRPRNRFVAEFLGKMNLFPLQGISRNGSQASGRFGDSPLQATTSGEISNQPQLLAVRPEHMTLHTERPQAGEHNVLPACLGERVYQGSSTHLALNISPELAPVNLSVPGDHPGARLPSGTPVWLSWPVRHSFLLEA
ncbi:ABC transporter ATP-binding protein [Pseudomonas protegens]|uniref:ABC transporter ATP-binding protein n=1 Tax=Pseudomonas protegens TaxID=380021 RepID=UPI001B33D758|nr:ABC transporter ATP-binding protein [Pseudomonas protegens]MBP5104732.1 ABC transporter ATP-binding protein [Pseudomonas protegens]MBP5128676.1 ABC transporter ATP-binding protein [Pseudomonas protegens]MBP5148218.1 ABC transporter ATP-binding protein [Pseudomonas protegens]QEN45449.1 spermidine/putrescine ABC transporter [Pseudomonas protegens]